MNRKVKNLLANLPEDLRISKLLRQLSGEKDAAEARNLCKKLSFVVLDPANVGYMRRSFDILADSLVRVYRDCPAAAATDVADVLGKMGWMLRGDLTVYRGCVGRLCKAERTRALAMRALLQTLKMDAHSLEIRAEPSNRIIELLKEQLETVQKAHHFTATTDAIRQFALNYPKQFAAHFTDVVDIMIGWHLETQQPLGFKHHCSMVLQSFKPFWLRDMPFTRSLLAQFLEDIGIYRDEMVRKKTMKPGEKCRIELSMEICCGSTVGATTSILKCIYDSPAILCQHLGVQYMNDIVRTVLDMVRALEQADQIRRLFGTEQFDTIYYYMHEMIAIGLDCRKAGVELPEQLLLDTVAHQLAQMDYAAMPTPTIRTALFVVNRLIAELRSSIPLSFVRSVVGPEASAQRLKFSHHPALVRAYVRVYQTILGSKNVELLQDTYRHICDDLAKAVDSLSTLSGDAAERPPTAYTKEQAELVVCFHLAAISTLATATSSIIVMWVLEPNILELLTERLQSHDSATFWHRSPEAHHAIITLLISHCRNNNNFLKSSALLHHDLSKVSDSFSKLSVADESAGKLSLDDGSASSFSAEFVPGASSFVSPTSSANASTADASPTAMHFELILRFLGRILANRPSVETTLQLLDWCECIIGQVIGHADILETNAQFLAILGAINRIATEPRATNEVQFKAADCFAALLAHEQLDADLLEWMAETCCVKMCASEPAIRDRYAQLFGRLPVNVSMRQIHRSTGMARARQEQINAAQHWYLRTPIQQRGIEMRSQFFVDFMRAIRAQEKGSNGASAATATERGHRIESTFRDIFTYAQCHETRAKTNEMLEFDQAIWSDVRVLMFWVQCEAAQSCVSNKLRTALGKPQETFIKIESTVREFARLLASTEPPAKQSIDTILANQRRARILLGFMECLEKCIHNASDGMAVGLPAMEKPVRTFFRVNATTCNEWFNRIRPAVDIVGTHCMEPEMVVRYTESVLKHLVANGKVADPLFEHTLITHALALLRNNEGDALLGLFEWTKSVAKKKFGWIRLMAGKRLAIDVVAPFFDVFSSFSKKKNLNDHFLAFSEQANGHIETAVAGYRQIWHQADETRTLLSETIADQLILNLADAHEWTELHDVFRIDEMYDTARLTVPRHSLTMNQVETMMEYERSKDLAVLDLGNWDTIAADSLANARDFSSHRLVALAENTVCNIAMLQCRDQERHDAKLVTCAKIARAGLQECLRTGSREHINSLVVLNHICHKLTQRYNGESVNGRSLRVDKSFGSKTATQLLMWSELFDDGSAAGEPGNLDFRLDACSTTRKEGNLALSRRHLEVFFKAIDFVEKIGCPVPDASLERIADRLITAEAEPSIWNAQSTRGVCEMAKWLYSSDKKDMAIQCVAANAMSIGRSLGQNENAGDAAAIRQRMSRAYLTMAEWLLAENDQFWAGSAEKPLGKLANGMDNIRLRGRNLDYDTTEVKLIMGPMDFAIGKLLSRSVLQSPDLSKTYGAYGNWCYRWGRKMVEHRAEHDSRAGLRNSDLKTIVNLLPKSTVDDIESIMNVLDLHKLSGEDGDLVSDSDEIMSTEQIKRQLQQVKLLSDCSTDVVLQIVEIWREANRDAYSFYEMAADCYFKYLQLATQSHHDAMANVSNTKDDGKSTENCSIVTATLRILRLIVKHALGLQEVLEQGLETTPTTPWKVIIPQLFSRLNHHEPYVRRRVSELLCRVAKDSPHLIIFPAVVGAIDESQSSMLELAAAHPSDVEHLERHRCTTPATAWSNSLLETLSAQAGQQVSQVQLLVRELKRITLLWEELWATSLTQIYAESAKAMTAFEARLAAELEDEASGTAVVATQRVRLALQYDELVEPILLVMERLHKVTSGKPETPNEMAFQQRYQAVIVDVIGSLRQPLPFDTAAPEPWAKFKRLYAMLQQRSHKRLANVLKMADISPALANFKHSVITMPGVEHHRNRTGRDDNDRSRWIYIQSVENFVHILPTKTKPKKLAFYGSDGRRYNYLFKGLEDLHLDERIMQILAIANSMMSKTRTSVGQYTKYRGELS